MAEGLPLIIAEAGVNHNGERSMALELVKAAADAGADIVKFQAFDAGSLVAAGTTTAAYQRTNSGASDQQKMLEALELDHDDFEAISQECKRCGIEFLCTAFDIEMIDALCAMGMRRIKIPSGEITNIPALTRVAAFGLPVLLSTGMADMSEVKRAVSALNQAGCDVITLLHCTSLYPAPAESVNLRAITTLREETGLPVGYSDHTLGDHIAVAATALGASVLEKHFTLDRDLPGPDHKASISPAELGSLITKVRETAIALGDGVKAPAPGEESVAALVRRSWHAQHDLARGAVIGEGDIALKRPADGLAPGTSPVGRTLARDLRSDEPVCLEDLAGEQ